MDTIGLVELIDKLKQELLTPKTDNKPLFAIGDVEIEVSFTANRSGDGRVDLKVVSAGMDIGREHVQRIKLTLKPLKSAEVILRRSEEEEE